jgi:hypothetical protein
MSANGLTLLTTLYYRTTISPTDPSSNNVRVNLVNTQNTYAGVSNRFMMDASGNPNNDVISFVGYRTLPDNNLGVYSIYQLFNETLNIQTKTGFINATAIYNDEGTGSVTTIPYVQYAVSATSGEFEGAKIVTIFFDNVNKTRRVEIYGYKDALSYLLNLLF